MLFVVCCVLFVVGRLRFVVCCSLFLLLVVRCSLFQIRLCDLLLVVWFVLCVVYGWCLAFGVLVLIDWCLLRGDSWLLLMLVRCGLYVCL